MKLKKIKKKYNLLDLLQLRAKVLNTIIYNYICDESRKKDLHELRAVNKAIRKIKKLK